METRSYRRPDSQWKCGRVASGQPCPLGPDHRGRCESEQCHPQRTLHWWRSYLPIAFATATIGIVVCLIVTQQHREVIAPGPLTMAHAQLIHNPSDLHRCASCHEETTNRFSKPAMDNNIAKAHTQTERCLVCHLRELPQLKRSTPHDLPKDHLESMTAIAKSQMGLSRSRASNDPSPPPPLPENGERRASKGVHQLLVSLVETKPIDWHQHELACIDCHREHQGSKHDLQAISSQRCQACHQKSFNAFSDGHPEFSDYPAPSSERIAFDHARHRDLHFSKSSTQFDCRVCHVNGAEHGRVGQVFRSVAFETACASCHLAPIKSSLSDGIIVFQLPSIDIKGLAQRGSMIDKWPEEAGQLLDGSIPPLMRLLLQGEAEGSAFLEKFPASGKLSDFNIDDSDHRQSIAMLASASRNLLSQLASGGQRELQKRLLATIHSEDRSAVQQVLRGVPPDLFRQAYRDWFENGEMQNLASNAASSSNDFDASNWKPLKAVKHLEAGGWMIDRQRMAIVYVPEGHADPWLTAMLTFGSRLKSTTTDKRLESLLAKDSAGRCLECHPSVDSNSRHSEGPLKSVSLGAEPSPAIKHLWRADRFDARVRQLTRFDHGPHLIQPSLTDCVACHRMVPQEAVTTSFSRRDFESMSVKDCATCHQPKAAGNNCTQCHNYHTNGIEP